jgi:hypothetical protein
MGMGGGADSSGPGGLGAGAFGGGGILGDRLGGWYDAQKELEKDLDKLNPFERELDRISPSYRNLYDKEGWDIDEGRAMANRHQNYGGDYGMGMGGGFDSSGRALGGGLDAGDFPGPAVQDVLPPLIQQNPNVPPPPTFQLVNNPKEFQGIDLSAFDLNRSLASTDVAWGVNPISNISHSDTMSEYAERAAAERALYAQIAQQITQAAGQSTPSTGTTVAGPTTGSPTTGNPPTVNDPRPKPRPKPKPEPRNPQPPRGRQDPRPEPRNPIDILVKTLLTPKRQMRQLAPHARKALREGRNPDFSMLPDYQQDLVSAILSGPSKPTYARMSDR